MDVARQPRLRFPKAALAVPIALALVAITAGFVRSAPSHSGAMIDRKSIWTDRVRRGDLVRQVPVQGTLVPEHVEWLSATSAGQVARIAVRPGAAVEPDTVVVVLVNPDLELAALEAEKQAASAEAALIQLDVKTDADTKLAALGLSTTRAELGDAERHARVADRLAPEGLMSANDRDDALSKQRALTERIDRENARIRVLDGGRTRQLAAQAAELDRLREIAAFARRRLASLQIRAGIHGVVQDIPLENGQWVALGTVLAKISEPDRLKAEVRVAESDAKDLHRGLGVRFEDPGGNFRGHIERVDPAVVHGTVRLEVAIDDALPSGARADQTVSGYVEIEQLHDVVFVGRPAGAVDGATASVLRVDGDRRGASRITARFGRGSAREIEVVGGLSEGDEIVISDVTAPEGTTNIRFE